jgi:hypothetical protein
VPRFNTENAENRVYKLVFDHFMHVKAYIHAPINEKHHHLIKATRIWNELKTLNATQEAHRLAINYANDIGLVKRWVSLGGWEPGSACRDTRAIFYQAEDGAAISNSSNQCKYSKHLSNSEK